MTTTPDPIDVAIGAKIASRRLAKGMNQSDLGRAAGVTFQQIQKYEKGANRVSGSRMTRIAAALDVDVAYLFPADTMGKPSTIDQLGAFREGHELAELFVQMKPHCRESLLSVARAMAGPSAADLQAMAAA